MCQECDKLYGTNTYSQQPAETEEAHGYSLDAGILKKPHTEETPEPQPTETEQNDQGENQNQQ